VFVAVVIVHDASFSFFPVLLCVSFGVITASLPKLVRALIAVSRPRRTARTQSTSDFTPLAACSMAEHERKVKYFGEAPVASGWHEDD
jgi:hypothetical protein